MCGFADAGAGKLIGPDGNEMDSETFLASLKIYANLSTFSAATTPCNVISSGGVSVPLLFRVVTQQYGQGIVQYGNTTQTYSLVEVHLELQITQEMVDHLETFVLQMDVST